MNSAAAADRAARRAMSTITATQSGMHKFFAAMEARYGGSLPMDVGEQVITRSELNGNDLQLLFRHEIAALHVPGFYDPTSAAVLGRELSADAIGGGATPSSAKLRNWKVSTSRGLESSDVSTLGEHPPYNVVAAVAAAEAATAAAAPSDPSSSQNKAEGAFVSRAHDAYFEGVLREFRSRRQPRQQRRRIGSPNDIAPPADDDDAEAFQNEGASGLPPRLWPLDLLRLELDESWPGGAGLAREAAAASSSSRPYGGGLPRVMVGPTRWKRGFIHVDEMGPLNSNSGLFSANIYLQLPDPDPGTGLGAGETEQEMVEKSRRRGRRQVPHPRPVLHVWPLGIRSRWDWYRNAVLLSGMSSQDPEAQMRLWRELGTPHTVSVAPGDLVVLCAQRPHCAIGFQNGIRVSLQCFLQHQGSKERLLIDC